MILRIELKASRRGRNIDFGPDKRRKRRELMQYGVWPVERHPRDFVEACRLERYCYFTCERISWRSKNPRCQMVLYIPDHDPRAVLVKLAYGGR